MGMLTPQTKIGRMFQIIEHLSDEAIVPKNFAELLRLMLAWDPQKRISAGDALNHECWKKQQGFELENFNALDSEETKKRKIDDGQGRKPRHQLQQGPKPSVRDRTSQAGGQKIRRREGHEVTAEDEIEEIPTVVSIWKTSLVPSEGTPPDSADEGKGGTGASMIRFHADQAGRRRQTSGHTNALLLRY